MIPGINTTEDEITRMIGYLEERQDYIEELHLLPYHRIAENKYFRMRMKNQLPNVKEPDLAFMEKLRTRFEKTGLEVIIGG